jgi:RNA polymerase sigma-70 factor (TIGR02960 family)
MGMAFIAESQVTVSTPSAWRLSSRKKGQVLADGFEQALERHRRELHVHCYRMLGSFADAEDAVQETFLRAWRHRDDHAPGTTPRAWLYRIATNVCIDAIRGLRRRVTADTAEVTRLQPYPDVLLDQIPARDDDSPEAVAVARETVELAFITAIQALPARQRAVVALCVALDWPPAEAAVALGISTAAVNSALQRARTTLRRLLPGDRSSWRAPELSADERDVLRRFIEVHERGDAEGALALMRDDWVATMPPDPRAYRGLAEAERLCRLAFEPGRFGEWRLVPAGANRQPAAASYLRRPGDARYRAFKIDVLRIAGDKIVETTVFDATLFAAFGLPEILPGER